MIDWGRFKDEVDNIIEFIIYGLGPAALVTTIIVLIIGALCFGAGKAFGGDLPEIPEPPAESEFMPVPDRDAWFQGGFRGYMIDRYMEEARLARGEFPGFTYLVQVWADMETGFWVMVLTAGARAEEDNVVTWDFFILLPGLPTPYDFREETGMECIMSYYLDDYEWFHGRVGDI